MIRDIGPVYARKLVRAFGEKVFDVIEAEPERLREVTGIGKVRAKRITDAWAEQKVVREIMEFLHGHGVGTARAVRIFKTYGADAVEVMSENAGAGRSWTNGRPARGPVRKPGLFTDRRWPDIRFGSIAGSSRRSSPGRGHGR